MSTIKQKEYCAKYYAKNKDRIRAYQAKQTAKRRKREKEKRDKSQKPFPLFGTTF